MYRVRAVFIFDDDAGHITQRYGFGFFVVEGLRLDVDFITEQWEFDLYVKSLYSAMLWGKGFKGEEPI